MKQHNNHKSRNIVLQGIIEECLSMVNLHLIFGKQD